MVYTERAEVAAVSSGTSQVKIKQRCSYTLGWIFKVRYEKLVTHLGVTRDK